MATRRQKAGSGEMILAGQRVLLRPVCASDLPALRAWDDDPEIIALMGRRFVTETPEEWLQSVREGRNCRSWMMTVDEVPIGEVELAQINRRNRSAEIRICIGERAYWGQGIGTDALAHLLGFAFGILGLGSLYLRVYATNQRAIALYERLGFRREGMLRPSPRRNDPAPVLLMNLSEDRWGNLRQHLAV